MVDFIESSILYLDRLDKYKDEKPFQILVDVSDGKFGPGATQTNMEFSPHKVAIRNARSQINDFKISKHGFQFADFPSSLSGDDFDNMKLVESVYYPEVQELVRALFDTPVETFVINHQRRKRNRAFPDIDLDATSRQPVPTVHADFSPDGAKSCMADLLKRQPELSDHVIEIINVWKLTCAPTTDWPLAVCDYSTVDLQNDIEVVDRIWAWGVNESVRPHFNPRHQWYFLDKQTPAEVIILRNCDSRGYHVPFSFHAAFDRGAGSSPGGALRRESIEVRVACFLAPELSA